MTTESSYPDNLYQLVASHLSTRSRTLAVSDHKKAWSYEELGLRTDIIAQALIRQGVQTGQRVCLLSPKTTEAVAALLAILKIGCIYVPLDPTAPARRVMRKLAAIKPCHLIAVRSLGKLVEKCLNTFDEEAVRVLWLDDLLRVQGATLDQTTEVVSVRTSTLENEHLAVILFTSGSTGEPKGVPLTHEGIAHYVMWSNSKFSPGPGDRLSCHSSLCFDASLWDVFRALSCGAELHLVPPEVSLLPELLAQYIRDSRITQWDSVPFVLTAMAFRDVIHHGDFPDLRKLIWYGEVFPTWALRYWMERLPHVEFTNTYGPTETSITTSTFCVKSPPTDNRDVIPIGKPVTGKRMSVLDKNRREVTPGIVGDLYIGGIGVSPGYWRDPERTNSAFVEIPSGSGKRWYFTGDRASIDQDGIVHFHGRVDRQIKLRGYRIELDEINLAISYLPGIVESAVVVLQIEGFEGVQICAAYVHLPNSCREPMELRRELADTLPSYMLPKQWLPLNALPRNINGKIDYPAVEALFQHEKLVRTDSFPDVHLDIENP